MRHTFLTGFPGFIAGRLIEHLAGRSERWTFLVEPRFEAAARRSLKELTTRCPLPAAGCEILLGDITQPGLGLAASEFRRLAGSVDTVVHQAAVYDRSGSAAVAPRLHVTGPAERHELVRSLSPEARYHYVSTYAVAGKRHGIVREAELEHDADFNNHYEETKYEAERLVRELADEGRAVSIYRPAVVVGSSKDGSTAKFDGPYMLMKVMRRLPWPLPRFNVGSPKVRFQMVPIDFIIDAIGVLSAREDSVGKTFHLTDPDPYNTEEIYDLFAEAMFNAGSWLRVPTFLTSAAAASGVLESIGLQRQTAPYFEYQATFDCVNTLDGLDGSGVEVPRLENYVDVLVRYFLDHESGDPRR